MRLTSPNLTRLTVYGVLLLSLVAAHVRGFRKIEEDDEKGIIQPVAKVVGKQLGQEIGKEVGKGVESMMPKIPGITAGGSSGFPFMPPQIKGFEDITKLFVPLDFFKGFDQFKVFDQFKPQVLGRSQSFGFDAFKLPNELSFKSFLSPDDCQLKSICKFAAQISFMRDGLSKLPRPDFLNGAGSIKAYYDGLSGRDCEAAYSNCGGGGSESSIKEKFEEMKESMKDD